MDTIAKQSLNMDFWHTQHHVRSDHKMNGLRTSISATDVQTPRQRISNPL